MPFLKAIAPGKKSFDFDVNQISYSPARAKAAHEKMVRQHEAEMARYRSEIATK